MGRAMIIICFGVLVALGFVAHSTSTTGKMLNQKTVDYAEYTMAKNAAHTAIQMAMQEINQDDNWPNQHDQSNPWLNEIQGVEVALYTDYIQDASSFWEPDSLWLYSNAKFKSEVVQVRSLYLKQKFSSLVPDFNSALGVAADVDNFTFSMGGNARITGDAPAGTECEDKPGITTIPGSGSNFDNYGGSSAIVGDPKVDIDPDFSYQPTDELIARLANAPSTQYITGNYKGSLGTKESPGVYFVDGHARLTGGIDDGFGILVIRSGGELEYEDGSLDIAGNFTFNGLVIFENAYNFNARGTPSINGTVLVGHTEDYNGVDKIDIDLSGNIRLNYDCRGEDYAKMAAANAVEQNLYTRVVTSENIRYPVSSSDNDENSSILDLIQGLF